MINSRVTQFIFLIFLFYFFLSDVYMCITFIITPDSCNSLSLLDS